MRILGWIILIIGVVFLALFGLAQLGGGHIGPTPFIIAALLIIMGLRLRAAGKGLVASNPGVAASVSAASASGQPTPFTGEVATVELPLTPEVAAVLSAQNARGRRVLKYVSLGFFGLFLLVGIVTGLINHNSPNGPIFFGMFAGIGIATAGMIYGLSWLTTQRLVNRDLRGNIYLRTTGPVQVVRMYNGAILRLADRSFMMNGRFGMKELSGMRAGRVDYSPHGHVILGAWDAGGQRVYCLAGYEPLQ
jgi:hypothetical protein